MRRCSSFHSKTKKMGLAECVNTQQDLFDHSVLSHTVGASPLCMHRAPKARCMMNPYPTQNWPAYRQAQVNEKARFQSLLYELCAGIEEPPQHMGRPRLPLADVIFALCFKVYSTVAARRFSTDLREAHLKGYLSKLPSYNSIFDYFKMDVLTPYLKYLIVESSLPLKCVEFDFAVDSSGFSTGLYQKWVDAKWGKVRESYGTPAKSIDKKDWLKVHLMCGVKTNIVTSVEVTNAHAGDSPQFAHLVEQTSRNFVMNQVSADKAYSSSKNLSLVLVKGAQPYIPFRSNTVANDKRQSGTCPE